MASELASRVKTSLDELRMQVLGAQVLLGFQFQSLFQGRFEQAGACTRIAAAIGLVAICLSLAVLIVPPAQHRLVEKGDASTRIMQLANRCAEVSLGLLALALGSDIYVAASLQNSLHSLEFACAAILVSMGIWFGLGLVWRGPHTKGEFMHEREEVDTHTQIEQMLTEARVILPGAQAMLGFQLIVTMTDVFSKMVAAARFVHFAALGAVILSVVLLIAPAAVHRVGFAGRDATQLHRIGSRLVTLALVPLAAGIALDFGVATWRLSINSSWAMLAGLGSFSMLMGLWYVWPLYLRATQTQARVGGL